MRTLAPKILAFLILAVPSAMYFMGARDGARADVPSGTPAQCERVSHAEFDEASL